MTPTGSRGNKNLGERVKVLLADDSVTMHRAVRLALKNEPYEVITCDNGQDALRLCLEHHPKVILADLDMPGMTGPELLLEIRKNSQLSEIKLVLLCGSFDQVDESRLGSVPTDGRIWKPFEAHTLVAMLKTLVSDQGDNKNVREAAVPTGALSPQAVAHLDKVRKQQEVTSPELEKDLMEETFQVAGRASTQEIVRQSTEATSQGLQDQARRPTESGDIYVSEPQANDSSTESLLSDDLEFKSDVFEGEITHQESASPTQAMENLWSDDFLVTPSDSQTLGVSEDSSSAAGTGVTEEETPWSQLQEHPLISENDFEVVTSNIDIHSLNAGVVKQNEELTRGLSESSSSGFEPPPDNTSSPIIEIPAIDSVPGFATDQSEDVRHSNPTLVSQEDWVKDRDFSDYKMPSSIQEHHFSESTLNQGTDSGHTGVFSEQGSSVDSAEIRRIIQEEVNSSVKSLLKELLQEELSKVLSEIERD